MTCVSVPESIIADRYGRRAHPVRTRRVLAAALAVFVVGFLAFAVWVVYRQSQDAVTWTDLGVEVVADDAATVTFQVNLPPGATAVCAVRAVNEIRTEVGRRDVVVGPSPSGIERVEARLRTTERADGGGVRACVLR